MVVLACVICSVYSQQASFASVTDQVNEITSKNAKILLPQIVNKINGIIVSVEQNTRNRKTAAFNLIGLCSLTKVLITKHAIVDRIDRPLKSALVGLKNAIYANIAVKGKNNPKRKTSQKCVKDVVLVYSK